MDEMDRLIKALDDGKDDLAGRLAGDLFLANNSSPDQKKAEEFESKFGYEVRFTLVKSLGTNVGTIFYKNKRVLFS